MRIILGAIAVAIGVTIGIILRASLPTAGWGLSFRTEGAPPVGNVGSAQLKQYDAAYLGDTEENGIYLTFDAGY